MKYKYKLTGLDCANCTQKIEDRLNQEEDIQDCVISFATGIMNFDSKNHLIEQKIMTIIHDMEPDVIVENCSYKHKYHEHEHHHEHNHDSCCEHKHHHEHDHDCCCEHEHHHEHNHDSCCEHEHHHEELPLRDIAGGIKFHINGLDCANCAMKVETEIKKQPYIEDAIINFSSETLIVKAKDNHQLLDQLQKVIDGVESGVTLSQDKKQNFEKPQLFNLKENIELIEGIIVFIGALLTKGWFSTFLYISAYLLIGYKVILKALKNIGRKDFLDENFLMCLATFGALALQDYGEAIAVMLFYAIGEIFQGYAVNKTRHSISSLMDIKSEYANLVKDDEIIQVPPEEVKINEIIVVKVGEKIPLDGKVVQGTSMLDTSSLTGESIPRSVEVGDDVLSGVVNLSDVLYVEVLKPYEDSTVSRIIDLVENSASKKAQIEKFITRFARIYTPTVVGLAILLLFVPMILLPNQSFYAWLYRACTFLVVSCPCALVISIPLGLYA
ncbi:MAG: heavy metal translocating P-type ATPase, partial [Faecalibacillus sp.]